MGSVVNGCDWFGKLECRATDLSCAGMLGWAILRVCGVEFRGGVSTVPIGVKAVHRQVRRESYGHAKSDYTADYMSIAR